MVVSGEGIPVDGDGDGVEREDGIEAEEAIEGEDAGNAEGNGGKKKDKTPGHGT